MKSVSCGSEWLFGWTGKLLLAGWLLDWLQHGLSPNWGILMLKSWLLAAGGCYSFVTLVGIPNASDFQEFQLGHTVTYRFKCWDRWCCQIQIYNSVFGYFLLPLTLWTLPPRYFKQRHYQKWTFPNLRIIWLQHVLECKQRKKKKGKNKSWCVSRRLKAASFVSQIRLKETTKCPPEWSIIVAHPKNSLVSRVPDKLFFNPLFWVRNFRISRHPQSKRTSSVVSENLAFENPTKHFERQEVLVSPCNKAWFDRTSLTCFGGKLKVLRSLINWNQRCQMSWGIRSTRTSQ